MDLERDADHRFHTQRAILCGDRETGDDAVIELFNPFYLLFNFIQFSVFCVFGGGDRASDRTPVRRFIQRRFVQQQIGARSIWAECPNLRKLGELAIENLVAYSLTPFRTTFSKQGLNLIHKFYKIGGLMSSLSVLDELG